MEDWFIYILECEDKSFYVGVTQNVERRFLEHKSGRGGKHTHNHRPIKILYTEKFLTSSEAFKREKQLKGWTRLKKERLINKLPG